jgi:hypothetical protein
MSSLNCSQGGLQSNFAGGVTSLLIEFLTTPAKRSDGKFEPDPVQDRLYDALIDSFSSTYMYLQLGGSCECGECYHSRVYQDNDKFPYLTRFLADPPKSLTELNLHFTHMSFFSSLPDSIGGDRTNLKTIFIGNDFESDSSHGPDSLGRMILLTRWIENVQISNFHPSESEIEYKPVDFSSKIERLTISGAEFGFGSTGVPLFLHEKAQFPNLKVLKLSSLFFGSRANPLTFWKQLLSKSVYTLKELHYSEDIHDLDDPSMRMFPTLCIALSSLGSNPLSLEKLSLDVGYYSLYHLEVLTRSSVGWSLKHLEIKNYEMESSLAPTIASFQSLSSLSLSLTGCQRSAGSVCTDFLVEYAKHPQAMKKLKELSLDNIPLNVSKFQNTRWPHVEKLEIRKTEFGDGGNLRYLGKVFPALKKLQLCDSKVSLEILKETVLFLPMLKLVKAETVLATEPQKPGTYSAMTKVVEQKQNLMDIHLTFAKTTNEKALRRQKHFHKTVKLQTCLNRVNESLKPSTPDIPLGFYPHILQKCDGYAGTSGLFLVLKDKLLSEIGFA